MTCIVRQPREGGQATIPADYRHRLGITDDSRKEALHRHALRLEWFTVLWNVIEAGIAIVAGVIVGSTALIAFGADSLIEVTPAVGLLWRLYRARAGASAEEHSAAERKALYIVAATFFALAVYIAYESIPALLNRETPETSMVGLVLSILSLIIMPVLAYAKQRTGQQMGSEALQADAVETWVCSYLSLALLAGVGLHAAFGWWWADAVGALAMMPVILWQGWESLGEVREEAEEATIGES
jgi:cation diffusion facilitator family transporter